MFEVHPKLHGEIMNKERTHKWDKRFLEIALLVSTWSKDESTQVGSVIVSDDRIISTGYNGLCRNIVDDPRIFPERHERPEKYFHYEHSERNSIYNCARYGISTFKCTIYCTLQPCSDCSRAIIQSGIDRVVWLEDEDENRKARMAEDHQRALKMLKEAGVLTLSLRTRPPSLPHIQAQSLSQDSS